MAEITKERAQGIVKELIGIAKELDAIAEELRWPDTSPRVEHAELMVIKQICHAFGFAFMAKEATFEARNFLSTAFGVNCWTGDPLPEAEPVPAPGSAIASCPDCKPGHECDQHIPF